MRISVRQGFPPFLLLLSALLLAVAMVGCGKTDTPEGPVNRNTPVAPPAAPAPTATPAVAAQPTPTQFVTKHFDGVGVVTAINKDQGSVELNHGEIKGLMPAMKMAYYLKERSMVNDLKVGEKVDFTIEDIGGAETISAISPHVEGTK